MPESVLAVDIGNTRAKFGLFAIQTDGRVSPVQIVARVLRETPDLPDALRQWWQSVASDRAGHCSVAMVAGSHPETRDDVLSRWPLTECEPITIHDYRQIPVGMDVDFPSRVGVDRLLNVFAASGMLAQRRAVITVDSGTATTVDLMTSDRIFRGGSILPGLRLSAYAMHDYTARLPLIDVDQEQNDLPTLPGRNTEAAMRAGLFIGQLGAVRELIIRLTNTASRQYGETESPEVCVTGGGGRQLVQHLPHAQYVDSLPLHGLAMLAQAR